MTTNRALPPLQTADLPEVGGSLGPEPEDFVVDEIPAYVPSGTGEHVYVRVKKRKMTTRDAAIALARAARVPERDVGYVGAGLVLALLTVGLVMTTSPTPATFAGIDSTWEWWALRQAAKTERARCSRASPNGDS